MSAVSLQNNVINQQPISIRNKGVKSVGPRKALADIRNVRQNESVTFDKSAQKNQKLFRNQTPAAKKFSIHLDKQSINTPNLKSTHRLKGAPTPFKIYREDKTSLTQKHLQTKQKRSEKIDTNAEIEYMPPCSDKDFELPLPDYLQKVYDYTPTYNIDLSHRLHAAPSVDIMLKLTEQSLHHLVLEKDEVLVQGSSEDSLNDNSLDLTDIDHEALDYDLDHDESFSLEALDRELRAAQLDLPNWLDI